MNSIYAPMQTTRLFEPITTTARAFGLTPTGKPGGWESAEAKKKEDTPGGFNPTGYQQWGMDTNSPYLNQIFGLKGRTPSADEQAWLAAEKAKTDAMKKKQLAKYEPPKNPFDVGGW
jgi:hypothetical protein